MGGWTRGAAAQAGPIAIPDRALIVATGYPARVAEALGDYLADPRTVWTADSADLRRVLAANRPGLVLLDPAVAADGGPSVVPALAAARRAGAMVVLCGRYDDLRLRSPELTRVANLVLGLPHDSRRLARTIRQTMTMHGAPPAEPVSLSLRKVIGDGRDALERAVRGLRAGRPPDPAALLEAATGISDLAGSPELRRMRDLLRAHHDPTYTHSLRVAAGLVLFGQAFGIGASDLRTLALAGLLHDVGKALLPRTLLEKPQRLAADEWHLVRQHPVTGEKMIRDIGGLPATVHEVAARHHERLDGSGYPNGLTAAELDEASLLCAIVDMHVALTEPRAYKAAIGDAEAFNLMAVRHAGGIEAHFLRRYRELILDQTAETAAA